MPESAMFKFGLEPLEVMLMFPLAPPAEVGANCTLNVVLWPAFNVKGNVRPLRLKPVPLADAADMVTLAPPELVRVSVSDLLFPTTTFPKLRLAGFGVIWPGVTPVPVRPIFSGDPGASETIANVPLAAPAEFGENVTVKAVL